MVISVGVVLYENPRTVAFGAPPSETMVPLNVAPVRSGVTLSVVTVGGGGQASVLKVLSAPYAIPALFFATAS